MNELSNNSEPLFDKQVSKNTSETPTMYDAIQVQLKSPRPMIAYIKEHEPEALVLFAEEENKKGKEAT